MAGMNKRGGVWSYGTMTTTSVDDEKILVGSMTAPTSGKGVFMGLADGEYQFRVGNPAGDYLLFDGSKWHYPEAIKNPPEIEEAWVTSIVDDCPGPIVIRAHWTTGPNVDDSTHRVSVKFYDNGTLVASEDDIPPDNGFRQHSVSGFGANSGGFEASHDWHAVITLYKKSNGRALSSIETGVHTTDDYGEC